jgi:hypothetical protein
MTEFSVTPPKTREEIARALEQLHRDSVGFYATLSTPVFVAPQAAAWSPADHVRHLTKSMRALNRGLRLPPIILRLRFGRAKHASRGYNNVVAAYRKRLETFDGRNNPFAPTASAGSDSEAFREEVMQFHEIAVKDLVRHTLRYSEAALDRQQAPHPLLGNLTLREMLFFMLYHNLHHVRLVASRVTATR